MTEVPLLSVVICTHNRAASLRVTLSSLLPQVDERAEVLVVDNASTDDTREVVLSLQHRSIRYVHEPELGLCRARNAGWRAARGRYVAYLDDDALVGPRWVDASIEAFSHTPEPGVVGGRVEPVWEAARPDWLSDDIALSLTIVDWDEKARTIPDIDREWLVGANMALPRAILDEVGGFHPALDRSGSNMMSSGDIFLQKQVMKLGLTCFYDPAMAVRHVVPASRLERRWFRRRYFWQGISDATMELIADRPSVPRRLGRALERLAILAASPRRWSALLLRSAGADRFTRECLARIDVGYIVGMLGRARI